VQGYSTQRMHGSGGRTHGWHTCTCLSVWSHAGDLRGTVTRTLWCSYTAATCSICLHVHTPCIYSMQHTWHSHPPLRFLAGGIPPPVVAAAAAASSGGGAFPPSSAVGGTAPAGASCTLPCPPTPANKRLNIHYVGKQSMQKSNLAAQQPCVTHAHACI
jgi:hypothetical protein